VAAPAQQPPQPAAHPPRAAPPPDAEEHEWDAEYTQCQHFGPMWQALKDAQHQAPWPRGLRKADGKMLQDNLWCIPDSLTGTILRKLHETIGHLGGDRLWREAQRQYRFAAEDQAKAIATRIHQQCETCQACEPPHQPSSCGSQQPQSHHTFSPPWLSTYSSCQKWTMKE
jgi:hypothetical protein